MCSSYEAVPWPTINIWAVNPLMGLCFAICAAVCVIMSVADWRQLARSSRRTKIIGLGILTFAAVVGGGLLIGAVVVPWYGALNDWHSNALFVLSIRGCSVASVEATYTELVRWVFGLFLLGLTCMWFGGTTLSRNWRRLRSREDDIMRSDRS